MKRILSISLFLIVGLIAAKAQNTSSEECLKNISLYSDYMKQGNIQEALPFWRNAFCCCPDDVRLKYKSSNLNLYVNGVRIMKYLIDNSEGDLKEKRIDSLLWLYDERMALNANQKKAVLWRKAADYAAYRPQAAQQIYDLCKEAIAIQGEQSESSTIVLCMQQASTLYSEGKVEADEVLNLYGELTKITDAQQAAGKDVERVKETVDELFLRSGVASCDNLLALYRPKLAENKEDADFLEKVVSVLSANQCTNDKFYFEASEAYYKVRPSSDAAVAMAIMFKQQGDYKKVEEYYKKAIATESDNAKKSKYYVDLGSIYSADLNNPREARDMAKKAIELDGNNAMAYFLLGAAYAGEKNCGTSDFEKRAIYWAVVDCYEKAKQVDPSQAENANKFINVYKQYFPSMEDIFFNGFEKGKPYTVGCWINERTIIRPRE